MRKLKINRYCSEIDWTQELETGINLVVAGTGQGKTSAMMSLVQENYVGFVAPYVAVTQQVGVDYGIDVKVGMKTQDLVTTEKARVTSYHSIPRLLEMEHMDYLIIDEIHVLPGLAQFISKGIIQTFWNTVQELQRKFPHLKIVFLTATPHFIKLYPFDIINEIYVEPKEIISKPREIQTVHTTANLLNRKDNYLYLYPSKKMGSSQANKYNGTFICAENKEGVLEYKQILLGEEVANKRIFASTSLSTGLSLVDSGIDTAISNWMNLVDIVQFSSRIREGVDTFYVGKNVPFFMRGGIDEPVLNWNKSFEESMYLIGEYEKFISYLLHSNYFDDMMHGVLYNMIYEPHKTIEWDNLFY